MDIWSSALGVQDLKTGRGKTALAVQREQGMSFKYHIGAMVELPRACLQAYLLCHWNPGKSSIEVWSSLISQEKPLQTSIGDVRYCHVSLPACGVGSSMIFPFFSKETNEKYMKIGEPQIHWFIMLARPRSWRSLRSSSASVATIWHKAPMDSAGMMLRPSCRLDLWKKWGFLTGTYNII